MGEDGRHRTIKVLEQALADLKAEERLGADTETAPALEGERKVPRKKAKRAKAKPRSKAAQAPKRARQRPAAERRRTRAGAAQA